MNFDIIQNCKSSMISFLAYLQKNIRTVDGKPSQAWYGTGEADHWAVQSNLNVAGGLAVLAAEAEELTDSPLNRDEVRECALQLLRYALDTHCTGTSNAVNGKRWGREWISILGLERNSHAFEHLLPYMTDAERRAFTVLRCTEADFLADDAYEVCADVNGFSGRNKPESNLWNGSFLLRTASDMPEHPHAAAWKEKSVRLLLNGISVNSDADSPLVFAGKKLSEWHVGANFTDHYSLDHHGYMNIGYSVICLSHVAYLTQYFTCHGKTIPPEIMHHAEELWSLIRQLVLPDGRLLRIGGDTRARYTYCQCYLLPVLLMAHRELKDPEALGLLQRAITLLKQEQRHGSDGGFFSKRLAAMQRKSRFYYSRLESDPFSVFSFLLDSCRRTPLQALSPAPPTVRGSFTWHESYHNACYIRTDASCRSFVRAANGGMTTLCIPADKGDFAEWYRNMTGWFDLTQTYEEIDVQTQTIFPNGFLVTAAGTLWDKKPLGEGQSPIPALNELYAAAALPDGRSMICYHKVCARQEVTLDHGWKSLFLRIPNDIFNGERRTFSGDSFHLVLMANPKQDEVIETNSRILICDEALSLRSISGETFKLCRSGSQNVLLNCGLSSLYAEEISMDCPCLPPRLAPGALLFEHAWLISASAYPTEGPVSLQRKNGLVYLSAPGHDGKTYLLVINPTENETAADDLEIWIDCSSPHCFKQRKLPPREAALLQKKYMETT